MVAHLDSIKEDGPTLFWTLIIAYHGTVAQIIWITSLQIDILKGNYKIMRGDVEEFCDYARRTTESVKAAGGKDDQFFEKN